MGTTKHRLPGISCPHCSGPATHRKANLLSELVRDVYFRCENDDCGHHFVVQMAVTRTIVPSRTPKASVTLPYSPRFVVPTPANDDQPIDAPPLELPGAMTG